MINATLENAQVQKQYIVEQMLAGFDIRNSSGVELRFNNLSTHKTIMMTLRGRVLFSAVMVDGSIYGENPIDKFLTIFEDRLEDLKPFNRSEKARNARDSRDNKPDFVTDAIDFEYEESDRYDNQVVAEMLPNYSVSFKELWDETMTEEKPEPWRVEATPDRRMIPFENHTVLVKA